MPEFDGPLWDALLHPVRVFFDAESQTYWPTYVGALIFSAFYYAYRRRRKSLRLRAMVNYLFPSRIVRHPSTLLDLKLFIAGSMFVGLQTALLVSFSNSINYGMAHLLDMAFGTRGPDFAIMGTAMKLAIPVGLFLVYEFGYWLAHFMLHKISWLWEFHKVHHSAPVMTPLAELRQHPLELLLFPLIISLSLSFFYGLIYFFYGPEPTVFVYWNIGIFIVVFFSLIGHLRHSHVDFCVTGIFAYLIQTPAHHHIHHSRDRKHFDKNFGFCLSVWDWIFSTLYIPSADQRITFGITDKLTSSYSLKTHYFEPFRQAYLVLRRKKKPFTPTPE